MRDPAWLVICLLTGIDALWLTTAGMAVSVASLVVLAMAVGVMLALSLIYTHLRPDERLASLADNTAKLLTYSVSAAVFSCLVTALRAPMIDIWLDAADKAAGLDWAAIYAWTKNHSIVHFILSAAYQSLLIQIALVMVVLITLRRYDRVQILLWAYIISSLACVLIAAFLPAAGAFGYHHVALDTPYVQQFYALRNGEMKNIDLFKLEGIVQFPSFHFVLAILCPYVARGTRFLFPFLVTLNFLVIIATPVIGGHYYADLGGGAVLVSVVIMMVERFLQKNAPPLLP